MEIGHDAAMAFDDLPENFTDLPITTPGLAPDLVDLFFRIGDRMSDSLLLVAALEDGCVPEGMGPIVIGGIDWRCPLWKREQVLGHIAQLGIPKVIAAFGSGRWIAPHLLRQWRDITVDAFAASRTELVGIYVANVEEVLDISSGPMPVLRAA